MKFPLQRYNMIDIIANGLKPVNDKSKDNECFFMQISRFLHLLQRIQELLRGSERVKRCSFGLMQRIFNNVSVFKCHKMLSRYRKKAEETKQAVLLFSFLS